MAAKADESVSVSHTDFPEDLKVQHVNPVGTVQLLDHNDVVLIPTPSPDPRGTVHSASAILREHL